MLQNRVSYGYYFNDYSMGQSPVLSDEQFALYERRARAFLKSVCTGEIPQGNQEDVFACVCAIAEELYSQNEQGHLKSESIDGYSVTFKEGKNAKAKLLAVAGLYLGHLGVLYAGVE